VPNFFKRSMSTRRPALPVNGLFEFLEFFNLLPKVKWAALSLAVVFIFLLCPPASADQTIIVSVFLNQVAKGDFFVILKDDGDFLLKANDLKKMGFSKVPEPLVNIDGEGYVSLRLIKEVHSEFDEKTLTLHLRSEPALLQQTTVSLRPAKRTNIYRPRDNSFFLNYGLDYAAGGNSLNFQGLNVTNEAGLRFRDFLFFTSTVYSHTSETSQFSRLMSNVTYDRRGKMQRFVAGDFFAGSGDLGSNVNMGGFSFSKLYQINPYFIQYPLFDFSGLLALPSDVDLYLDGVRVKSEHFQPGQFQLKNFQAFGGAHQVEIVVRDSLGRERQIVSPFYFTDRLLRKSLTEYSYNIGLLRRDYGLESGDYADPAFSAFHRFGVTDSLTVGLRGEAGDDVYNVGMESLGKLGFKGLLGLQISGSLAKSQPGVASKISYEYQNRHFSARLALTNFSSDYQNLERKLSGRKVDYLAQAGIGYVIPVVGNLSLTLSALKLDNEESQPSLIAYFSRKLWKNLYLNTSYRHTESGVVDDEVFMNFSYYLGRNATLSASSQVNREGNSQVLEARKDLPVGEGYAWRTTLERKHSDSADSYTINPALQYNSPYGTYRGEFSLSSGTASQKEDLRLSVSGALVRVGDAVAVTRPVSDSFGLVKIGDAQGVRVYANSQLMGRTNSRGEVIVPSLNSFYDNEVSFEDKDIPMDYLMPRVRKFISPSYRSGSCLVFPLEKYQAFTGTLLVAESGRKTVLTNAEVTIPVGDKEISFYTGNDGEFYFDNDPSSNPDLFKKTPELNCSTMGRATATFLAAGPHPVTITYQGHSFPAVLTIPAAEGPMTDLGEVQLQLPSGLGTEVEKAVQAKDIVRSIPEPALPSPPVGRPGQANLPPERAQPQPKQATSLEFSPAGTPGEVPVGHVGRGTMALPSAPGAKGKNVVQEKDAARSTPEPALPSLPSSHPDQSQGHGLPPSMSARPQQPPVPVIPPGETTAIIPMSEVWKGEASPAPSGLQAGLKQTVPGKETASPISEPPSFPSSIDSTNRANHKPNSARPKSNKRPLALDPPRRMPVDAIRTLPGEIFFAFDRADLSVTAKSKLDEIARFLCQSPDAKLEIEGHADSRGSNYYNLHLGLLRARVVRDYLLDQGIDTSRIFKLISYGNKNPVCYQEREDCYHRNRRTVIAVANLK
jgi:outer membrane usher protein